MKSFLIYVLTCFYFATLSTAITPGSAHLFTLGFFEGFHEEFGIQNVIPCVSIAEKDIITLQDTIKNIDNDSKKVIDDMKTVLESLFAKIKICKGVKSNIQVLGKAEKLFENPDNFKKEIKRVLYKTHKEINSVIEYAQAVEMNGDLSDFGYVMGRIMGYTSCLKKREGPAVFGFVVEFE